MGGELNHGAGPKSLSEIANSGSGGGGSFVYDEATLRSLITKWVELADHYNGSIHRTSLGAVKPPGKDFASAGVADSANTSGSSYMKYLVRNFYFCINQAQVLQDTLDDYLGTEHHSVVTLTKAVDKPPATPSGPQPGI